MTDEHRPKTKAKTIVAPELDKPILLANKTYDSDKTTLDTGMAVGAAIRAAEAWWESKGRQLMRDKNEASDNPGQGAFTPNPQTVDEALNWTPSGIMAGKPWAELTKEEMLHITKQWHHNHVRVPNIDPELYQRVKKRPGVCFYCDDEATADEMLPNGEVREMCWPHFMDRYPEEAKIAFNEGQASNEN